MRAGGPRSQAARLAVIGFVRIAHRDGLHTTTLSARDRRTGDPTGGHAGRGHAGLVATNDGPWKASARKSLHTARR